MKKIIFVLFVLVFSMTSALSFAEDICITVNADTWDRLKTAFLTMHQNTECVKYDLTTMECLKKRYTDDEWVRERSRRFVYEAFREGEETIAKVNAVRDMNKDFDSKIMLKDVEVTPVEIPFK
jgi:hypothetical protein